MSSKIEVDRELVEMAGDLLMNMAGNYDFPDTAEKAENAASELLKLIAAPVVERQPVVTILQPDPYDERGGAWMSSQDLRRLEALPVGTKLYAAPPELAELQATIVRLTADNERLKGGQGEPVAWRYQSHAGGLWYLSSSEHNARTFQCNGECGEVEPLYTSQPAPVSLVLSFEFEHALSKEKRTVTLTKQDVFDGMEDYFYDKLGEQICQCESAGETNVVDCNCDEYVHDFEIVTACLDKVKELNP